MDFFAANAIRNSEHVDPRDIVGFIVRLGAATQWRRPSWSRLSLDEHTLAPQPRDYRFALWRLRELSFLFPFANSANQLSGAGATL